jgi:hypothetical protein
MEIDTAGWTGEGAFTAALLEALKATSALAYIRVEDAPSSRVGTGYAFISNEVFVRFGTQVRQQTVRRFGIAWRRSVRVETMTLEELGAALGGVESVGLPDYEDAGMLQYLRTEQVVPPYQTKGTKVIEMVRIYLAGAPRRE